MALWSRSLRQSPCNQAKPTLGNWGKRAMGHSQEQLNALFIQMASREHLLSIKVTPFYQRLIDEEVAAVGYGGPLHRTAYPTQERIELRVPGEQPDYVHDRMNMTAEFADLIVQKYVDRMLFFPTDRCAGHCQYCFRQDVLTGMSNTREGNSFSYRIERLDRYLAEHEDVREVILSGGDPLMLPLSRLQKVLELIRERGRSVRIHTRMLVFTPTVIRDEHAKLFAEHQVRTVLHVVHPYELTPEVRRAIEALTSEHVRVYSQFPLLRNVNDHPVVLTRLLAELDELHVRNLSIFMPDPINYSASFRLTLNRAFALMDELSLQQPSWINSTRLVLDTPYGKVRRENITDWPDSNGDAVFMRDGHRINYRDFPAQLDNPGKLSILLWKG